MTSADDAFDLPPEVFDLAVEDVGRFATTIHKTDARMVAADHLDCVKPIRRAKIIERYVPLRGKKVLEIGSGYGNNLAIWARRFDIEPHGIEPGGVGFSKSLEISRKLFEANGLDPQRLQNAVGEKIPFPDASFDIVYSANVLEHTDNPQAVIAEALRVLRCGGLLHFEMPNFLAWFEGHYYVPQPPIIFRWMLPAWIRYVIRRDPAFARTLRTEINPIWCRRQVRQLSGQYHLKLLSVGGDVFLDRIAAPFEFETRRSKQVLGRVIRVIQLLNVGNWIARVLVMLQAHYPIYLTITKV